MPALNSAAKGLVSNLVVHPAFLDHTSDGRGGGCDHVILQEMASRSAIRRSSLSSDNPMLGHSGSW